MCFKELIRKIWNGEREKTDNSLPQLLMWYVSSKGPDPGELARGYEVRPFQPGDEPGWIDLLNRNGQLGEWSMERIQKEMSGGLELQIFAVHASGQIAASTALNARRWNGVDVWEIGWVAVHPEHQGKGLGRQVVARAVSEGLGRAARPIYLRTDDFRIPALKLYLRLGFRPDLEHPSYRERWERIFGELGEAYQRYRTAYLEEESE